MAGAPGMSGAAWGEALLLSVNHSGDSDSTGAVCGSLLGAHHADVRRAGPRVSRPVRGEERRKRVVRSAKYERTTGT